MSNGNISMEERWKNDKLMPEIIGYSKVSDEERIKSRKHSIDRRLKQGRITEEQANRSLELLYEELGMLVAK